jgi:plastocyanin
MKYEVRTIKLQGLLLVVAGLFMSAAVAFEAKAGPPPLPQTAIVRIANFTFTQQAVTVRPGTTVTWVNDDDIPHAVVSKTLVFKSKVLDTGDRFSFTFAKAGQFGYFCSLHPHMTGTIIVKA